MASSNEVKSDRSERAVAGMGQVTDAGHDHEQRAMRLRTRLPEDDRNILIGIADDIFTALDIVTNGLAATPSSTHASVGAKRFDLVQYRMV